MGDKDGYSSGTSASSGSVYYSEYADEDGGDYSSDGGSSGSYSGHNRSAVGDMTPRSQYSSSESEDEIETKWEHFKYKLRHPFHKNKHKHVDPLAQYTKEEKITFMFGDSEERAERTKHQTQRWFESLAREKRATDARSSRLGKIEEQEDRFERLERMREFAARKKYAREMKEKDAARYKHETAMRDAEDAAHDTRMKFFAAAGYGREKKAYEKKVAADRKGTHHDRMQFEHDRQRRRMRELGAEQAYLDAEAAQTQWVVERMRQCGTIPGVPAPPAKLPVEQRETATTVVLRPLPEPERAAEAGKSGLQAALAAVRMVRVEQAQAAELAEHKAADEAALQQMILEQDAEAAEAEEAAEGADDEGGGGGEKKKRVRKKREVKKKRKPFFDVDLKRFRNAEVMRGERIGEKGGRELAFALRDGVCPRLHTLDLTWNLVRTRGTCALAEAWRDGCAKEIRTLVLCGCDIGPIPMRSLRSAFEAGWTQLVHLDLRKNLLGDAGACTVAHCVLQGLLPRVKKLLLQSNQIGDPGCTAVCKAITAEKVGCPDIEQVNLRFNRMSPLQLRRFASSAWARHPALQV